MSKPLRKSFQTSSGYEVVIRRLRVWDWVQFGAIPDPLREEAKKDNPEVDREFQLRITKFVLTHAVISFQENGVSRKVVEKHPFDCGQDEISWEEIPDPDSTEIFNEVVKFSEAIPDETG